MIDDETYNKAKEVVRVYEQLKRQQKENCYQIGINDNVLVKLKDDGYSLLLSQANQEITPQALDIIKQNADKEGYVQFQIWDFIQRFGSTIKFGSENTYFDFTLRFYKDQLK